MPSLRVHFLAAALACFPPVAPAAEYLIDTVAGTGAPDNNGDEGPASRINIGDPFGVEIGPDGALYVCETRHHRVRRVDLKTGALATVAGVGRAGYSGDGGPATRAELNEPYEVRFDPAGDMYFVEMKNHVVRKVDMKTGVIRTVAGSGAAGFAGDGGPAIQAKFLQPHSIALDAAGRQLYIADIGNHRVRRVDLASGVVETIAGDGQKKLPVDGAPAAGRPVLGPRALFVAGDTLWVALREGHSVWTLDLAADRWKHVAGTGQRGFSGDGGPAKLAKFDGPKGIALAENTLYVVDTENHAIRAIDLTRGVATTLAGGGPQAKGGEGDGGPAAKARLDRPHGVCVGPGGVVYIGDSLNHRVRAARPQ